MSKGLINFFSDVIQCQKCSGNEFMIVSNNGLINLVCCKCFSEENIGTYDKEIEDTVKKINFRYYTSCPLPE